LFDFIVDSFGKSINTKFKLWYSFLITLFLFVLINNLSGLLPGGESPNGNINVTAALAIGIFLISQISGFFTHGFKHIVHLIPSGIPVVMLVFFIPLELISLIAKPFSLAVRLFANMMAGHKVLSIFATLAMIAPSFVKLLPFGGVVLISFFEMFVSFIQAFIFTYLASFYISDAVNGSH
jgi:F-type H+-transporting ATPase subunit a